MSVRKYIPPISILLFLALTLAGTWVVRKKIFERELREAAALQDAPAIESALKRWPCPLHPESKDAKDLVRWAMENGASEVYRICIEKGVAPVDQSWFPLGGEVYFERDRDAAAESVLAFREEPRWFKAWPRMVSKAEHDAWLKGYQERTGAIVTVDGIPPDGKYSIPGPDRHPREAMDLPAEDQDVTLSLKVSPTDNAAVLCFDLTLSTRKGDIKREVEHRWTNLLPFLFAFYVNGIPYYRPLNDFGREGGANGSVALVKAGESRTWSLRVSAASLAKLLPRGAREATIVAAFSDRQHEGWFEDGAVMELSEMLSGEPPCQLLLRSNPVAWRLAPPGR